ncbi:hypothetical protein LguiB_018490 [Lonicera macranthoides]
MVTAAMLTPVMEIDGDVEEASRRVQVRFITKLKAPFKAPTTAIAIPSNLTRLGLSAVVNNLLKAGKDDWNSEPFDFLIEGELVRMSLENFLLAKGISAERVLEIEYIRAVVPRKEEEPSLHDDWVSAVDASNPGLILTGCYDGLGRIWKAAGLCTHLLEGHSGAITSVSIINPSADTFLPPTAQRNLQDFEGGLDIITPIYFVLESGTDLLVATGSKDRTLRLWMLDADESMDHPTKVTAFRTLRGHSASVQSIAPQASGDMVCSGSWDSRINVWYTKESDTGADLVSVKKRRKDSEDVDSQSEGEAASTLVGHTQCVSSVVWPERGTIYSASWDHSIRRWDVETGKDSMNMFCGKVFNCLDVGGERTSAPIYQFSSNTSWISACKWHDKSWFHLLSASYDGKVMLWDLRTAWPVTVIDSHKDKVLCADWWKGDSVVSGGVDSKLCISSEISLSFVDWESNAMGSKNCVTVIDSHKDKVLCADWWKGDSVVSGGVDSKLCISSEVLYSLDLFLADSMVPLEPFRTWAHSKVGRCTAIQGLGPQGYAEGDVSSQLQLLSKGCCSNTALAGVIILICWK